MNLATQILAALLLLSTSLVAQTEMFVASQESAVQTVNDLVVDPGTGDQYMLITLEADAGVNQMPLLFESALGSSIVSDFTWNPAGGKDACLARLAPSGECVWALTLGSALNDELLGLDLDSDGNIAVTGYVQGDVECLDVSGTVTAIDFDESHEQDCFTASPLQASITLSDQAVALGSNCLYSVEDFTDLATVVGGCSDASWDVYHTFSSDAMPGQNVTAGTYTMQLEALASTGGYAVGTFQIVVSDQTAPEFDALDGHTYSVQAETCKAIKPDLVALLDDFDCSGVWADVTYNNTATGEAVDDSETSLPIGDYQVHVVFSDLYGTSSDYAFDLSVFDVDAPVITQLQTSITAACNYAVPNWAMAGIVEVSDACSDYEIVSQIPAQGSIVSAPYDLSVCQVTVQDVFGNQETLVFSLTVVVEDIPALSGLPASFTVAASPLECVGIVPDLSSEYLVSSCSSYADWFAFQLPQVGEAFTDGQLASVYLAHPFTGETTGILTTTLHFEDLTAPVAVCPVVPVSMQQTDDCQSWVFSQAVFGLTVSDNCTPNAEILRSFSHTEGEAYPLSEASFTATYTDLAGNHSSCEVGVEVVDVTAPILLCPEAFSLELPADGSALSLPDLGAFASAIDCGVEVPVTPSIPPGTLFIALELDEVLGFSATDAFGNVSVCETTFSIVDVTPPVVLPIENQVQALEAYCGTELLDYTGLVVAEDVVSGIADIVQVPAVGIYFEDEVEVTLTVTDGSGNETEIAFAVFGEDQTLPELTCPGFIWVDLDSSCAFEVPDLTEQVLVQDNCATAFDFTQFPAAGSSLTPTDQLQLVEVSADDGSGNQGVCYVPFWINDAMPPSLMCGGDLTYAVSETSSPLNLNTDLDLEGNVEAFDPCGAPMTVVATPENEVLYPGEYTVVQVFAADTSGNVIDCSYAVKFIDDLAPVVDALGPVTLSTDVDDCAFFALPDYSAAVTVFDHSDYAVLQSPPAGNYLVSDEVIEVTLTATDAYGNAASITLDVTVEITFPGGLPNGDVSVEMISDCTFELPNYIPASSLTDACGNTWDILQIPAAGTALTAGALETVIFVISGQETEVLESFDIAVSDNQVPVWNCPDAPVVQPTFENSCLANLSVAIPEVNDNCGIAAIELQGDPLPAQAPIGTYEVTYRAYDTSGNFSDCTVSVVVEDQTPPSVNCPEPVTLMLPEDGSGWAFPDVSAVLSAIDCTPIEDLVFEQQIPAGTLFTSSQQGIECAVLVTDLFGNATPCTLLYTVIDQSAPELQPMADQELDAGSTCSNILPDYTLDLVILSGGDNLASIVQTPAAGSPVFEDAEVNITVTTEEGVTSELNFTTFLIDAYAPTLLCGELQFIQLTDACGYEVPDFTGIVEVADNCSATPDIEITQFTAPGSTLYPWVSVQTVGISAIDEAGNEAVCNVQLWITDAMPPEITCADDVSFLLSELDVYPMPTPESIAPSVYDPCFGGTSLAASQSAFELYAGEEVTYFFTASDGSGNQASCSYSATLLDDVQPQVNALSDTTIFTFNADCSTFELPDFTPLVEAWDHSEIVEISQWPMPGIIPADNAPLEVLVKVMDSAGNITYIGFTVNVESGAPESLIVSNDFIELGTACSIPLPEYFSGSTFEDACGNAWPIVQVPAPGYEVFAGETVPIAFYLASDLEGDALADMTLTVVDVNPPEWTCLDLELVFETSANDCLAQIQVQAPEVWDFCGVDNIEVIQGQANGALPPGAYSVTFMATDPAGLSSNCTVYYTVVDHESPAIVCDQPALSCVSDVLFELPMVSEACGDGIATVMLLSDPALVSGASFPEGITEVVYSAEDASGNSSTCTTFVEVNLLEFDFEMPFASICKNADPVQLEIDGEGDAIWGGAASESGVITPISTGPGTHEITLEVFDGMCTSQAQFELVIDEMPELTFSNMPEMWCLDGGPIQLEYEASPGSTWEWAAPVSDNGVLDPSGMEEGLVEVLISGQMGACLVDVTADVEISESITFTWSTLPSSMCSNGLPVPIEVDAPEGATVDFNSVLNKEGAFDPQSWNAGTQTVSVSVALPGCFASDSQSVTIVDPPEVFAGDDTEICGPVTSVQASCSDPFADIEWTGPEGMLISDPTSWMSTVTYQPMGGADVVFTAISGGVCAAVDSVHMHFTRPPTHPSAGPDQHLELISESALEGFYQGPGHARWRALNHLVNVADSSDLESPVANLQHGLNRFHLVARSGKCPPRIDSVDITVNLVWQIPSGFSPNGDRTNDFFVIDGLEGKAVLKVFNRWGEEVYHAKKYHNQWDGRSSNGSPLPDDTYFYILDVAGVIHDGYIILKR